MHKLTAILLEREKSKYDELIDLVDSSEIAAQVLDDITYTIAGILNGGLEKMAESETYYYNFMSTITLFTRSSVIDSGPIHDFVSLLKGARSSVRDHAESLKSRYRDDYEEEDAEFKVQADKVESWLYNKANLEALSSALIDYFHRLR